MPPIIIGNEREGSSFELKIPAWGPIISKGYAGNIQIGVIWAMVKVCVDHLACHQNLVHNIIWPKLLDLQQEVYAGREYDG